MSALSDRYLSLWINNDGVVTSVNLAPYHGSSSPHIVIPELLDQGWIFVCSWPSDGGINMLFSKTPSLYSESASLPS